MRNLNVISINHQTISAEDRIKFDLSESAWEELSSHMTYTLQIDGHVILRTCNRIEIYYDSHTNHNEEVASKWIESAQLTGEVEVSCFETFTGYRESIVHLLELSAGLKSAIFGDDQILSQLKKAFENARVKGSMSTLLERAYQSVMRFHKKVCKHTDFKSHTVSLAYQALKSARYRFGTDKLKDKNVLVIGAGDMAAQIVKYLPKFTFNSVTITNRTQPKAEYLVKGSNVKVADYSKLDIAQYDVIVSCTDQGFGLIKDWTTVEYYIDLSLRSAQLNTISTSHILLNDLQELISQRDSKRMNSLEMVYPILEEMRDEYVDWCHGWSERMRTRMSLA